MVDHLCYHAGRFAENLLSRGFRITNRVVFNQC